MRHKPRTRAKIMNGDQGVDIVGDVHACYGEFLELLQRLGYVRCHDGTYRHPAGRKLLSLGDITSRGPDSIRMLQFFVRHVAAGLAEMVDSNHGWKIARWLDGRPVMLGHGDEKVAVEFQKFEQGNGTRRVKQLKDQSRRLLFTSPSHMMIHYRDQLAAVAVHAGIRDDYIGKETPSIQSFCRYGEVAGTAADGRPIRRDWAAERTRTEPLIVWGHDPRPQPERKNGTLNIDQGCVFGGLLTAYRFPEDEIVSVPARENYSGLEETPLTRYRAESS